MKNMGEQITKPRKIALYVQMEHEFYTIAEVCVSNYTEHHEKLPDGEFREEPYLDGYTRVSEPIELEFKAIGQDEIIAKAVESLNETERRLMVETEEKLAKIRKQKEQLLALSYKPEAS